ncbi:hypothetical protein Vadar_002024 [Vaccinium darrowii]|uniref:Uncharacterized protein n=1 Tax=Vaccinium darrowii TaxID=229202 RepID=A0ACB7Y5M5_9ERIC|nr:hypothetical protein Vadar_002024 [Vaccinium darrowii]
MGAATKIWSAMEVAEEEEAREKSGSSSEIIYASSLTVDHSLPLPQMTPRIIELCKDLFKNWSELDDAHFSVKTVSGGITNLLLKVSVREETGNIVNLTVRLYGPNTEYVINRERELQAIRYLSAAGFGAKLLAVFGNGMVQSFIDARQNWLLKLQSSFSIFHQVEIPGSKEPQLWIDIFKFFQKASSLTFDDGEKQRKYETISFEEVHNEVIELKELTGHLDAPVVFAHNDLLSGNLMLNDEEEKLYLIDFEYGSYNYRGFDIGNHFNEYAGYDCDYSLYPTKDEQYHFLRHYLEPKNPDEHVVNAGPVLKFSFVFILVVETLHASRQPLGSLHELCHGKLLENKGVIYVRYCLSSLKQVSDEDLEALYIETNTYMLASHLYWALWALIQAKMSPIDFDYLSYFFLRYDEYKKQKASCFSLAKSYLSRSGTG